MVTMTRPDRCDKISKSRVDWVCSYTACPWDFLARRQSDVDGRELAWSLNIVAGRGHDGTSLQALRVAGRRLDGKDAHQRQLADAGIAEDHVHALLAQQLEERPPNRGYGQRESACS